MDSRLMSSMLSSSTTSTSRSKSWHLPHGTIVVAGMQVCFLQGCSPCVRRRLNAQQFPQT